MSVASMLATKLPGFGGIGSDPPRAQCRWVVRQKLSHNQCPARADFVENGQRLGAGLCIASSRIGAIQTNAKMRHGPPLPPRCVGAPTTSVAPDAGTRARFFRFSMP